MKTENITSEICKGKTSLEGKNLRVLSVETESDYWIRRITLIDESGQIYILQGDSAIKVSAEKKPEPVTRWIVAATHKRDPEMKINQICDEEGDAEVRKERLGDDWTVEIKSETGFFAEVAK